MRDIDDVSIVALAYHGKGKHPIKLAFSPGENARLTRCPKCGKIVLFKKQDPELMENRIWNQGTYVPSNPEESVGIILAVNNVTHQRVVFFNSDNPIVFPNKFYGKDIHWINLSTYFRNDAACLRGMKKRFEELYKHDITVREELFGIDQWLEDLKNLCTVLESGVSRLQNIEV